MREIPDRRLSEKTEQGARGDDTDGHWKEAAMISFYAISQTQWFQEKYMELSAEDLEKYNDGKSSSEQAGNIFSDQYTEQALGSLNNYEAARADKIAKLQGICAAMETVACIILLVLMTVWSFSHLLPGVGSMVVLGVALLMVGLQHSCTAHTSMNFDDLGESLLRKNDGRDDGGSTWERKNKS